MAQRKNEARLPELAEFADWFGEIADEIDAVQGLLSERLSDDAVILTEQMSSIEAWHARMNTLLADANSYLDLAQHRELMTIDRELTVLERETILNAKVVTERRVRNILLGLSESIRNRMILGMSSRKQSAGERSHHAI